MQKTQPKTTPKISAVIYPRGSFEVIREKSKACISYGIDTIYFPDHLDGGVQKKPSIQEPWQSIWPCILDIGERHKSVTLGPMVASAIIRPAQVLALESLSAAQSLGEGRFVQTIGAGGAKSDLEILGLKMNSEEIKSNFSRYIEQYLDFIDNYQFKSLHEVKTNRLRLASESRSTIDLVVKNNSDWVTTGGWGSSIQARIAKTNSLYEHLKSQGFNGRTAFHTTRSDGLTIMSSNNEIKQFIQGFSFNLDELIVPI